jgi:hypothetical protein
MKGSHPLVPRCVSPFFSSAEIEMRRYKIAKGPVDRLPVLLNTVYFLDRRFVLRFHGGYDSTAINLNTHTRS